MTGFGKGEIENESFTVTVEIKSVNHRFRDLRFKMSNHFNKIELPLRKKLEAKFKRGSFDIYVNYKKKNIVEADFNIDEQKVASFLEFTQKYSDQAQISINATDFLRSDFMKEIDDTIYDELATLVESAFSLALDDLEKCRNEEGKKLKDILAAHKSQYSKIFTLVEEKADLYREGVENRLMKSFDEFSKKNQLDEPRFLQEVVYYLEKLDVHEEINRIKTHLSKFDKILVEGGEVGRQLDFLFQEFNRETNTIGSKSGHPEISDAVVQMKVQLEKMREQALNLV
jgi:uncharacterized protein (TIGR00255 family)